MTVLLQFFLDDQQCIEQWWYPVRVLEKPKRSLPDCDLLTLPLQQAQSVVIDVSNRLAQLHVCRAALASLLHHYTQSHTQPAEKQQDAPALPLLGVRGVQGGLSALLTLFARQYLATALPVTVAGAEMSVGGGGATGALKVFLRSLCAHDTMGQLQTKEGGALTVIPSASTAAAGKAEVEESASSPLTHTHTHTNTPTYSETGSLVLEEALRLLQSSAEYAASTAVKQGEFLLYV